MDDCNNLNCCTIPIIALSKSPRKWYLSNGLSTQRPLPERRMLVVPAISFTREIYPFRMAKFVAHKVEVGLASKGNGKQPYHFMQSNSPVNKRGCYRPSAYGNTFPCSISRNAIVLSPNKRLVVWFAVGNRLYIRAGGCSARSTFPHAPIFITGSLSGIWSRNQEYPSQDDSQIQSLHR